VPLAQNALTLSTWTSNSHAWQAERAASSAAPQTSRVATDLDFRLLKYFQVEENYGKKFPPGERKRLRRFHDRLAAIPRVLAKLRAFSTRDYGRDPIRQLGWGCSGWELSCAANWRRWRILNLNSRYYDPAATTHHWRCPRFSLRAVGLLILKDEPASSMSFYKTNFTNTDAIHPAGHASVVFSTPAFYGTSTRTIADFFGNTISRT
jgi:hypothetical protein